MVIEVPGQPVRYQCESCKFKYPTRELAERCQAWCDAHQSCNLEIIKYAVKDDGPPTSTS